MSTPPRRGGNRQREGREGQRDGTGRPQRGNGHRDGQRGGTRRRNDQRGGGQRRDRGQDEKREKQPFVAWFGEEKPSKGPILDLETYKDKGISVVFTGGREIEGVLTGFDSLMNLVLDNVTEKLDNNKTRPLGTLVARGPLIQSISPVEGAAVIDNPF